MSTIPPKPERKEPEGAEGKNEIKEREIPGRAEYVLAMETLHKLRPLKASLDEEKMKLLRERGNEAGGMVTVHLDFKEEKQKKKEEEYRKQENKVLAYLQQAAEKDYIPALLEIYKLWKEEELSNSTITKEDAVNYYKKAANLGSIKALLFFVVSGDCREDIIHYKGYGEASRYFFDPHSLDGEVFRSGSRSSVWVNPFWCQKLILHPDKCAQLIGYALLAEAVFLIQTEEREFKPHLPLDRLRAYSALARLISSFSSTSSFLPVLAEETNGGFRYGDLVTLWHSFFKESNIWNTNDMPPEEQFYRYFLFGQIPTAAFILDFGGLNRPPLSTFQKFYAELSSKPIEFEKALIRELEYIKNEIPDDEIYKQRALELIRSALTCVYNRDKSSDKKLYNALAQQILESHYLRVEKLAELTPLPTSLIDLTMRYASPVTPADFSSLPSVSSSSLLFHPSVQRMNLFKKYFEELKVALSSFKTQEKATEIEKTYADNVLNEIKNSETLLASVNMPPAPLDDRKIEDSGKNVVRCIQNHILAILNNNPENNNSLFIKTCEDVLHLKMDKNEEQVLEKIKKEILPIASPEIKRKSSH